MKLRWQWLPLLLVLVLCACAQGSNPKTPTDNPSTGIDESVIPSKGQPAFPELGDHWVIDVEGACGFSADSVAIADVTFRKLQEDKVSEVVVICIEGIVDNGPFNDEKIWSMDWGNWSRLGVERRGLIWLIRPDVEPKDERLTLQNADWLYSNTVFDYFSGLEEAANYANWNDYDGCLESIVRTTDETLRRVVKQ